MIKMNQKNLPKNLLTQAVCLERVLRRNPKRINPRKEDYLERVLRRNPKRINPRKEDCSERVLRRNPRKKRKPSEAKKRRLAETENAIIKLPNTRNKFFGIGLWSGSFRIVPSE
jgi:hypothetical protein